MNGFVDFVYGQTTESSAAYGQFTYSFTESLDITAGLRYTEDKRNAFLFNETLGHTSTDDKLTNRDSWDNISYLLTANYVLTPDINVYATYSTGYNGGGFNSRASSISGWEEVVDEEELYSYELGMKSSWLDNRLRINAAVFYNDYTDMQIAVFEAGTGGASSRIVNAGEATYQGFELEILPRLTEGLTLEATYGYLDPEFDEYRALNPATNQIENIADATTVTRAPENTASAGLEYRFPPLPFGNLSARVDLSYTDEFVFHPFLNTFDASDSRTLVNARVTLNDVSVGDNGNLRISAWSKNVTDEEYQEWGIDFATLGYAGNIFGQPRTFGLDAVYEF
jgi:iron complex outermembrane receptor protein